MGLGGVQEANADSTNTTSLRTLRSANESLDRQYRQKLYFESLPVPAFYRLRLSGGTSSTNNVETTSASLHLSRNWLGIGQTALRLTSEIPGYKYEVQSEFTDLFLVFGRDFSLTLGAGVLSGGTLTVDVGDTLYTATEQEGVARFGMVGFRSGGHEWLVGVRQTTLSYSALERPSLTTGEIVTLDVEIPFSAVQTTFSFGWAVLW